jgi:hypothetical protein
MRAAPLAALVLLLAGCRPAPAPTSQPAPTGPQAAAPAGALSVRDHGARGDGSGDDRPAIQAAIDAASRAGGGVVFFPDGTYQVQRSARGHYALLLPGRVTLRGASRDGVVLREAPRIDRSVRLIQIEGDDNQLEQLTLDGNAGTQEPNEHRHGIFVTKAQRLVVKHVTSRNFSGDGFYLYHGATDASFVDVLATDNHRNGLTLGGDVERTSIVGSQFVRNRAQQLDSEPKGAHTVRDTTVTGSLLDAQGVSQGYVLTCSGTRTAQPGNGWKILGNTINGGIFVVWTHDVEIAGNTGVNPTRRPWVTVNRSSSNVRIVGNKIRMTQTAVPKVAAILVQGTAGSGPANVLVSRNLIEIDYEKSFAVRVAGAISVEISGNDMRGAGRRAPGYAAVHLRATMPARDFERAVVNDNQIRNFGERGIQLVGNGAARLLSVDIRRNHFFDDGEARSMTTAISLDDGTGAARSVTVADNEIGCGVESDVINVPAGATLLASDTDAGADGQPPSAPPSDPDRRRVVLKRSSTVAPAPCQRQQR